MNGRGEIRELHTRVFDQGKSFGISDRYKLREEGSAQARMDHWEKLEAAEWNLGSIQGKKIRKEN